MPAHRIWDPEAGIGALAQDLPMHRVRAAIDDWGDAALLLGAELDVQLVAPLSGGRTAFHLSLMESFHGGVDWVRDGQEPLRPGAPLCAGEVELLTPLERLDPASAALHLRIARGVRLAGFDETVRALVLVPPGLGGRLRIDAAGAHPESPGVLASPVDLIHEASAPALVVRSEAGVRVRAAHAVTGGERPGVPSPSAPSPSAPSAEVPTAETQVPRIALPLEARVDVEVRAPGGAGPPFGIVLRPPVG